MARRCSAVQAPEAYAFARDLLPGVPDEEVPICCSSSGPVGVAALQGDLAWESMNDWMGTTEAGDCGCTPPELLEQLPSELKLQLGTGDVLCRDGQQQASECVGAWRRAVAQDLPASWTLFQADRFRQQDAPPPLPDFELAPATLRVSTKAPHHCANAVLDYLETKVPSRISKICRVKYTTKATVFGTHSSCSVKMRMYEVTCGSYAIEFQRRQGDTLLFMELFEKLAEHLG
jgi:hypothetical protein